MGARILSLIEYNITDSHINLCSKGHAVVLLKYLMINQSFLTVHSQGRWYNRLLYRLILYSAQIPKLIRGNN